MTSRDEREARTDFTRRYSAGRTDVTTEVERRVIGTDYGANGFTTGHEADELGRRLGLRPGLRLLDVGAGRGWPGLYLAATTGCAVVLTDLPAEGLVLARDRARADGFLDRVTACAASASALPFARETFDAVVHSDVLC